VQRDAALDGAFLKRLEIQSAVEAGALQIWCASSGVEIPANQSRA